MFDTTKRKYDSADQEATKKARPNEQDIRTSNNSKPQEPNSTNSSPSVRAFGRDITQQHQNQSNNQPSPEADPRIVFSYLEKHYGTTHGLWLMLGSSPLWNTILDSPERKMLIEASKTSDRKTCQVSLDKIYEEASSSTTHEKRGKENAGDHQNKNNSNSFFKDIAPHTTNKNSPESPTQLEQLPKSVQTSVKISGIYSSYPQQSLIQQKAQQAIL